MTDASVTISGNLTADPELRFTQSGIPVAGFNVAHTPRRLNKTTNEWEDGETLFLRVNVWRDQAENVANSLRKGAAVLIFGRLVSRPWETKDGEKRASVECDAEIVSVDLRRQRVQDVQRQRRVDAPEPQTGSWDPAPAALRADSKAA